MSRRTLSVTPALAVSEKLCVSGQSCKLFPGDRIVWPARCRDAGGTSRRWSCIGPPVALVPAIFSGDSVPVESGLDTRRTDGQMDDGRRVSVTQMLGYAGTHAVYELDREIESPSVGGGLPLKSGQQCSHFV